LRFIFLLFLTFTSLFSITAYEKGHKLYMAYACYACHGHKLEGMNTYPRLANRSKGYLTYKLKHFRERKADTQQQEMMIDFALPLSDEDINNLTTFFTDFVEDEEKERYDDSYESYGDGGS